MSSGSLCQMTRWYSFVVAVAAIAAVTAAAVVIIGGGGSDRLVGTLLFIRNKEV